MKDRRLVRALGVATLLVALLAVVALAAGGRTPLGREGSQGREVPMVFWDYVLSTAVVLFLVAVPFLIWLFWASSRAASQNRRTGRQRDLLVVAYVALTCATVLALDRILGDDSEPRQPRRPQAQARQPAEPDEEQPDADFRLLPLVLVAGAAVGLVAYQGIRARRQPLDPLSEEELRDELAALVEDTLDDLREEPDPRRAVISAYARMERVLAAFDLARLPFEGPLEYAQRVVPEVELVPGASRLVFELTHLYERAKFSPHEVDLQMKEQAIAALVSLRAELLAPT